MFDSSCPRLSRASTPFFSRARRGGRVDHYEGWYYYHREWAKEFLDPLTCSNPHHLAALKEDKLAETFHWPNGKRIAVAVTVMLETWSEGKAPPYSVQA